MTRYPEVPELLEQYMEETGTTARRVPSGKYGPILISKIPQGRPSPGFLQKIFQGPFFSCRYKVTRIEKFEDTVPPYRIICRYLVGERPMHRRMRETSGHQSFRKIR